ncbi:glycosyltransferase family 2 protein [Cellulomonas soli]|nr:glycosyltransferase family 2 protein [Cellulomonas soli]NYI60850.1 cellulose synthase/poly-beta-1,6-N-acetylglucosamine synthase-like glycosyltransferase [Cellulomonas soli]
MSRRDDHDGPVTYAPAPLRPQDRAPHVPSAGVLVDVPRPRPARERPSDPAETPPPTTAPWAQRAVGLAVFAIAASAATALWLLLAVDVPEEAPGLHEGILLGVWHVLYDTELPPPRILLAALLLAVLLASGVALLEQRISTRSRRSVDQRTDPLAPKLVMAATRGVFAGPVTVAALIPAHDEEYSLPATIASLKAQSHPPERIVVIADNCTDGTVEVARRAGVEVVETVANTRKKAGALNQVLARVLPELGDNDTVLVMDADTMLDAGFLETAVARMSADRALMALGGLFYGEEGAGVLGQFQRNEYIRYAREMRRRDGRVLVLTGTASLFRPAALRAVADGRGTRLPGTFGDVYDTAALTEDNELTLALKSLGALMTSPPQCTVVTEVMPTWRTLWAQRLRWQRGALENLGAYGVTPRTFRYWAQQLGIGYGVIALGAYFLLVTLATLSAEQMIWFPFWIGLGGLFALERVVTVWHGGWRARLLAAALLPELVFDAFLDIVYVKGVLDISLGRQASWKHVVHTAPAPVPQPAGGRP